MNQVEGHIIPTTPVRMFQLNKGLYWKHRIHEGVNLLPNLHDRRLMIPQEDIHLMHDGYDHNKINNQDKIKRNIRLLRMGIAEEANYDMHYFYLGRELAFLGQFEESLHNLNIAIELGHKVNDPALPEIMRLRDEVQQKIAPTA